MRQGPPLAAPVPGAPNSEPELAGAVPSKTGAGKSVTGPLGRWMPESAPPSVAPSPEPLSWASRIFESAPRPPSVSGAPESVKSDAGPELPHDIATAARRAGTTLTASLASALRVMGVSTETLALGVGVATWVDAAP